MSVGNVTYFFYGRQTRQQRGQSAVLSTNRRLQGRHDLTPPCPIKTPKPVRPISTPWFLRDWLDTVPSQHIPHCRSRSAPYDIRGRQHGRQNARSRSVSKSPMNQCKFVLGVIGRPNCEQSDWTAQKSSALSVSAADYRSHAENHGCVWIKAGSLPQHVGHTVSGILTRPRDSPPVTDDEARRWAEVSKDAKESLESNLSAAFYKAGFIPQPGHPGGTLAL